MKNGLNKIRITYIYIVILIAVTLIAALSFISLRSVMQSFNELQENMTVHNRCHDAFDEMRDASAYLTDQSRCFVVRGDKEYLQNYVAEVRETQRREHALSVIEEYGGDSNLYAILRNAAGFSNDLALIEIYAMELAAEGYHVDVSDLKLEDFNYPISAADEGLDDGEKIAKAIDMLYNDDYFALKSKIVNSVYTGVGDLVEETRLKTEDSSSVTDKLLIRETFLTVVLIILIVIMVFVTVGFLVIPLRNIVNHIRRDEKIDERGVSEVVYLARAYNALRDERKHHLSRLSYEASHDSLTGIYNRKVFEEMNVDELDDDTAMMLVDVDLFKTVNDTYGHEVGDAVLKKVAASLEGAFRSNDYVFRIGGDEFAVLLVNMKREFEDVLLRKIQSVRDELAAAADIPETTLSIGVAFNDAEHDGLSLFRRADTALYESKENGRNRTSIYHGEKTPR